MKVSLSLVEGFKIQFFL